VKVRIAVSLKHTRNHEPYTYNVQVVSPDTYIYTYYVFKKI